MKKSNIIKLIIFILVISSLISCTNDENKKALDNKENRIENEHNFFSIVLKYYKNKEFDALWIDKFMEDSNMKIGYGTNKNEINKLINYFKSFEYLEIKDENILKNYNKKYEIRFKNTKSDRLEIEILDKKHLKIGLHYLKEIKDESKDIIKIKENQEHIIYKINGEIDYDFIETIFKSLK